MRQNHFLIGVGLLLLAAPGWTQESNVPVEARPLTNLEAAIPPARPGVNGTLIVTAPKTDVYAPPGTYVDLAPPIERMRTGTPDSVTTLFIMDGKLQERRDVEPKEKCAFRVETGRYGEMPPRRARIGAMDAVNRPVELMQCTVRSRDPLRRVGLNLTLENDVVRLTIPERKSLGAIYLFQGDTCLGRLKSGTDFAEADMRPFPAGTYRFAVIGETEDGILLPCVQKEVTLTPRYKIEMLDEAKEIAVPEFTPNMAFPVRVVGRSGLNVAKTKVYLSGQLIGQSEKAAFDTALPLRDVPTGPATVEVVGFGADGVRCAMETATFTVKNLPWEKRILSRPEYRKIEAHRARLAELEQQAVYWVTRLTSEPTVSTSSTEQTYRRRDYTGRVITLTWLNTLSVPGRQGEYRANARKAILQMAQVRLEVGRLYRALGMTAWAEKALKRVVQEAGPTGMTCAAAQTELKTLAEETRRD